MIWADKIAAVWAALILLTFFAMWASAGDAAGFFVAVLSVGTLKVLAVFVLPAWVALRLIDFATGGPARRRGVVRARIV